MRRRDGKLKGSKQQPEIDEMETEAMPCPLPEKMGDRACRNRAQCRSPCGDLHSAEEPDLINVFHGGGPLLRRAHPVHAGIAAMNGGSDEVGG